MEEETVLKIVFALVCVVGAMALLIGLFWLQIVRMRATLRAWANEGGFQIVGFKKKNLTNRGPFRWATNSPNQSIFHVRVRDREGKERTGWVRCGSYLGGMLFSKKVEVKWDAE
jgi:hypothetical protein